MSILPENSGELTFEILQFLARWNFNAASTSNTVIDNTRGSPIIEATSPSCRLLVANIAPDGSSVGQVLDLAGPIDRVFIVFRGKVYGQQPVRATLLDYAWSKFLRGLGLVRHVT